MALQKEDTLNPFTSSLQSNIIIPFIINKKSPRVIRVTGRVRNTSIGFINIFNSPKTTATIKAVMKLFTDTPGKK